MAGAEGPGGVAVGRAFTGLAAGTWVPLVAVFSGLFPRDRAVFASSLLTFSGSVGRMLSTGLNGVLVEAGGYALPFILAALASGIAVALILITRVQRQPRSRPSLSAIVGILRRRDFLLPTLMSMVVMFGSWAVTFGFLPIRAADLGAGDVLKSLLIAANIGAVTAGNLANTVVSTRVRNTTIVFVALVGLCGGMVLAALAPGVGLLFVATLIMGLSNGFNYPTLMGTSIQGIGSSQRTVATGIHQSVYAIGMFTGPWIAGVIADTTGIPWMFVIVAALCLVAGGVLWPLLSRSGGRRVR
jgi:MFS family permease